MYIETIIGPFEKNNQITLDKQNITHIGIEQLNSLPIIFSVYVWSNESYEDMSYFNIENNNFYLNAGDILEFDNIDYSNITITPLSDTDEYTIITIGYESKGE